ncbi:MAG: aldehyde dehydrogenase family protein [Phycisphaera sp.]|nr:aldehyde dehydrogenase family protein [Phycisphaera sp.]
MKTWKLFIGGAFPRTESGRTLVVRDARDRVVAHCCRASRKDLRNSVEIARKALPGWWARDAYNRGQILYRLAEMAEARASELVDAVRAAPDARSGRTSTAAAARSEVEASIDRLVSFAGWCDKYPQVVGCRNPVNGPYHDFTMPEPTGVCVGMIPSSPTLLGLVSVVAPMLAGGNVAIAMVDGTNPLPAMTFAEICATSDVPAGVINILTGHREELVPEIAAHRDIDAIGGVFESIDERRTLEAGSADDLKRVRLLDGDETDWKNSAERESPWTIEPFTEMKTIWHPSGA